MTANEMADELDQKLDRVDSYGGPGYEDFDYSSILTEAQHMFVKMFFDEMNNRKGKGFQEIEIRNQGLGALIQDAPSLTVSASQVGVFNNGTILGKFFDLPLDHMYTTYEECTIDKLKCGSTTDYIVAYITHVADNEIQRHDWNKYKKPYYKSYGDARVWRKEFRRSTTGILPSAAATAKRHELITDGTFNVTNYHIRYVKNPENIIVDRDTPTNQRNCELDYSTHPVILDLAMDLMLQRIKEQKMQIVEPFKALE
jgi:hypothetical protein